jgi:signal transduction histidine kinase
MLVGYAVLFASIINDILYAQSVINTTYTSGLGLVLFLFSQSYVITKRFTNALLTAEELTTNLEWIVKDQTSEIKDLLDSTGQGILSFDESMNVQNHASRATQLIFENPVYGRNILDLLFPEKKEEIKGFLEILFKSGGKLNLVKDLLPTEFVRNHKYYDIAFRWIPAGKKAPARIMVILTDITIKRKLEMMLAKDEQQNQKIIRIAVDRHGFLRFYNGIQNSLLTIESQLKSPVAKIDKGDLASGFHTIKGGLAGYSFLEVAEIAHKAETLLETFNIKRKTLPPSHIEALLTICDELKTVFKEKIFELGDLIPKQLLNVSKTDFYRISEEKIACLERFLKVQQVDQPELAILINDLRKQPLRNTLKKIASDAKYIAFQEGKQVTVEYSGEDTQVIHSELDLFFSNMVHLVRNAIDHGIEPPGERRNCGKSETGKITITVTLLNREFTLVFADDGRGIDVTTLKEKAVEIGIRTRSQVDSLSDQDAWLLIFEPGLSVKKELGSLSGRGIGMDAVVRSVNRLGGTIGVRSGAGTGTAFTFQIPVSF